MAGLRQITPDAVGCGSCGNGWIADCNAADLRRSRHISLKQRRRNSQHVGNIVKAVARIVRRLVEGSVLAEGTMEEIQRDEAVIEAYLGR